MAQLLPTFMNLPLGARNHHNNAIVVGMEEENKEFWIKTILDKFIRPDNFPANVDGICCIIATKDAESATALSNWIYRTKVGLFKENGLGIYQVNPLGRLDPVTPYLGVNAPRRPAIVVGKYTWILRPLHPLNFGLDPVQNIIVDLPTEGISVDTFTRIDGLYTGQKNPSVHIHVQSLGMIEMLFLKNRVTSGETFFFVNLPPIDIKRKDQRQARIVGLLDACTQDDRILVFGRDYNDLGFLTLKYKQHGGISAHPNENWAHLFNSGQKKILFMDPNLIHEIDVTSANKWINYDLKLKDCFIFQNRVNAGIFLTPF